MKTLSKRFITVFISLLMLITIVPSSAFAIVPPEDSSCNFWNYPVPTRTLSLQSPYLTGNDVKWVQCSLNYLSTYGDINNTKLSTAKLSVDGIYGPATRDAVKKFQKQYGLGVTGNFGTKAIQRMKVATGENTNLVKYFAHKAPTRTLVYQTPNLQGDDVKWIQTTLNFLIILGDRQTKKKLKNVEILEIDGIYGTKTRDAVSAFQSQFGLNVSGKFGPVAREKMKSLVVV